MFFRSQWGSNDHLPSHKEHGLNKEYITSKEHTPKPIIVSICSRPQSQSPPSKFNSNNNIPNTIIRSQSHDVNINADNVLPQMSKQSQSETNLDYHQPLTSPKSISLKNRPIKEQQIVDEETYSTDSTSSTVDEEVKRRRRKLFPTFTKKNKSDKVEKSKDKNKVSD